MLFACRLLNRSQLICLLLVLSGLLSTGCRKQPATEKASEPSPQATVQKNPVELMSPVIGKPYPGIGVITIINVKEGWVEINHEPIEGLMPAMQMEWWVKDRSLLKNVQVGDKVEFVVVETGKGEFITEMKKAKAPE